MTQEARKLADQVTIRPALPADLSAIMVMVEALTRHHDDVPRLSLDTLERDLFGAMAWFHVLVAECASDLVGYAALLPLARLGYGERGMDLHHLFVVKSARHLGTGTLLVQAAEQMARVLGCSYLIIGTHPENAAAQDFYVARGYLSIPNASKRFQRKLESVAVVAIQDSNKG